MIVYEVFDDRLNPLVRISAISASESALLRISFYAPNGCMEGMIIWSSLAIAVVPDSPPRLGGVGPAPAQPSPATPTPSTFHFSVRISLTLNPDSGLLNGPCSRSSVTRATWLAVLMALRATSQFSPGPLPAAELGWVAFHEAIIAKATWRHDS